jgi:pumilio RNA-binding family
VEQSGAKHTQRVPSTKADIDHRPPSLNSMTEEDGRKMMEQLKFGGAESQAAVASMIGSVLVLSLDAIGCRIVQEALEVADHISREILVFEMKGHVRDAMRSPHANFVIQKIIEVMPVVTASFVSEELTGIAAEVARHRYGCRILCRLLEHHSGAESIATKILIDELLRDAAHQCHHSFARHVIDSVLEHGTPEQRHKVAVEITGDVLHNARNRNASYVVERAFGFCSTEDQRTIASKLLDSGPDRVVALAMHDCGSHVVKALLRSNCTKHAQIMRQILKAGEGRLTLSKYGKRVLEEI